LKRKDYYRYGYLEELEVRPGARVLEVSVGTGANIPLIRTDVDFFGLDLTWAMLERCRGNLRKWKRSAELFQGEAERLPFIDGAFDVVFHVGGINFFNDKPRAIREMIRVAKPGTKIVIADETEKTVKESYAKTPIVKEYFKKGTENVAAPVDLIPSGMLDVRSKNLAQGRLYCLTFRTPCNA
jgi:ubiquinone/menaquinone biosynthesis C-methylase UbiE